jgi:outer membrane receptor for ferrienterochelin and colicins
MGSRFLFLILMLSTRFLFGQNAVVTGIVKVDSRTQELVSICISKISELSEDINDSLEVFSNSDGSFYFSEIKQGDYNIFASFLGFKREMKTITVNHSDSKIFVDFNLTNSRNYLNEVVITGTKTSKRRTNSPVIVNVINSQSLDDFQACTLSDGLKFQPGLRVETNCQTCNYTQLRLNGLAGGYSQILINGRPIFSPLMGMYGLEQLPKSMIDRIEVVRGGGSSLYGSSAIGGTVNVITKLPKSNSYSLNSFFQNINGKANDIVLNGDVSMVSEKKQSGMSFFFNNRTREIYDHNDDGFSEMPEIENLSFGVNFFFLPTKNQKLEFNLSNLNEYRYGGEMVNKPAYLTQQSEERKHKVWMSTLDHQINFNDDNSSFITYAAWQNTNRNHYTGIYPEDSSDVQIHLESPPYGTSKTTTFQTGFQLNHRVKKFLKGSNTFTVGGEYLVDDVFDQIPSYQYMIDQISIDLGAFLQSDWELSNSWNLLSGIRIDNHNMVDELILSPRFSILYKHLSNTQFRINYGSGFRAPQSFDTDLHMAFAAGGVSRIMLSPNLRPEKSQSVSASLNYDKPREHFILGFTLESFYTRLNEAFYLQPIGNDSFGELFEKQNGQGATVQGVTAEFRVNYDKKIQLESGLTIQTSMFDERVQYIQDLEGIRQYIRTPTNYGFATLSISPNNKFRSNINYIYTGKMFVPHFSGSANQLIDEIFESPSFSEVSFKTSYKIELNNSKSAVEFYFGIKNIFNSYQSNFDIGKNRDSNFIFGPSLPRTFYIGIQLSNK